MPFLGRFSNHGKINIHEAIELYIEDLVSRGETVPDETSFDTFETVIHHRRHELCRRFQLYPESGLWML